MSTYVVTSPSGQRFRISRPEATNTATPKSAKASPLSFLERGRQRTEAAIAERPSAIRALRTNPIEELLRASETPLNRAVPGIGAGLALVAPVLGEAVEAPIANAQVAIQQRKPWAAVLQDMLMGVTGERSGRFSDVWRGINAPEPVASAAGLAEALMIPLGPKPTRAPLKAMAEEVQTGAARLTRPSLGEPSTFMRPNPRRMEEFATLRQRFLKAPKIAGTEFELNLNDALSHRPELVIDHSQELLAAQQAQFRNPAFGDLLRRASRNAKESTFVQSLLTQPEVATNLTMPQSQMLKRVAQNALRSKFIKTVPEYADAELEMLDLLHAVRLKQLEAMPEFADIAAGYAKALKHFREVKPYLSPRSFQSNVLSQFGQNEEVLGAIRELVPRDILQRLERLHRTTKTNRWFKEAQGQAAMSAVRWGAGAAVGVPAAATLWKMFGANSAQK